MIRVELQLNVLLKCLHEGYSFDYAKSMYLVVFMDFMDFMNMLNPWDSISRRIIAALEKIALLGSESSTTSGHLRDAARYLLNYIDARYMTDAALIECLLSYIWNSDMTANSIQDDFADFDMLEVIAEKLEKPNEAIRACQNYNAFIAAHKAMFCQHNDSEHECREMLQRYCETYSNFESEIQKRRFCEFYQIISFHLAPASACDGKFINFAQITTEHAQRLQQRLIKWCVPSGARSKMALRNNEDDATRLTGAKS